MLHQPAKPVGNTPRTPDRPPSAGAGGCGWGRAE